MKNKNFQTNKVDVIKRREVTDFLKGNDCRLAHPEDLFTHLHRVTNGSPCNKCNCKPCKLFDQFKREDLRNVLVEVRDANSRFGLKTNAELAAELGITKRQVAKRRIPGTNEVRKEESPESSEEK